MRSLLLLSFRLFVPIFMTFLIAVSPQYVWLFIFPAPFPCLVAYVNVLIRNESGRRIVGVMSGCG